MIRVGLVGAGVMGLVHGRSVNSFGALARVTRVFDSDRSPALAVADELGSETTDSVEEVVGAADVDAVVISIPPRFHRAVVELTMAHGKRVFLEKPVAIDRADATAILDAVRHANGTLMVGHVLRFWPGYPEVHAFVAGGTLGAPISVVCTRLQPPPATTGWLADVDSTGGIAPLVLVHDFDLMNWLLGTPLSVSSFVLQGAGSGATHAVVGVTYERGRGLAEGSIALPKSHPFATSIDVYCERGSVHFGYEIARNAQGTGRDASQFTPSAPPVITIHPDDGGPPRTIEISGDTPWRLEMEYFLRQVSSDGAIEIGSPQQAVAALDVALAARASFGSGRTEVIQSGEGA